MYSIYKCLKVILPLRMHYFPLVYHSANTNFALDSFGIFTGAPLCDTDIYKNKVRDNITSGTRKCRGGWQCSRTYYRGASVANGRIVPQ